MPAAQWSQPTRHRLPLILIRGFGGLTTDDERRVAYQGFNDGSVYPHKRGENYIYEGFVLRMLKTDLAYTDATNVVGFFEAAIAERPSLDSILGLEHLEELFFGSKIVADPRMVERHLKAGRPRAHTIWVFRYYDLADREFAEYGRALVRLIALVRELCREDDGERPKVNIVAHSMGGLIVREAIQNIYEPGKADEAINKIVTLGTPHKGISFQLVRDLRWLPVLKAGEELEQFNPDRQGDEVANPGSWRRFHERFPLERLLCVVGTNYRTYSIGVSTLANRLFPVQGEFGLNYNRSDGLVKQVNAVIDGAPRTFVHKCHGGGDSLMTARESFEVATRFFFGDIRVRVYLVEADVKRKLDMFGKSEIFFGLSIKPRRLDFDLFHQSAQAENCYGPFARPDLTDKEVAFPWVDPKTRLIWEGFLNSSVRIDPDIVMRAEIYVGERDLRGIGFSDNIIFQKQYFVRAVLNPALTLEWHVDQNFQDPNAPAVFVKQQMDEVDGGWHFRIGDGDSFTGTLRVELDWIPEDDRPQSMPPGTLLEVKAPEVPGGAYTITGIRP